MPAVPAADLLVDRLARRGVREVFGYPGGQLTPIYDAILRRGDIRHYLARHEQAAAFMADGYARASGRVGVCLAVCGPGVYNAATPLATAHTDSVPVLLISGQVPTKGAGLRSGYYHENDQAAACRHFTKAAIRVENTGELVRRFDHAWQEVTTGRPGPVLLEVPVDVLRAEVPRADPPLPLPFDPPTADVPEAARVMAQWKRPVILAGGGVVASGAEGELAALATRLGAPVFHTANGKCALPASHPLHAGLPWHRATSDLSAMGPLLSPLFAHADGMLAVGCRFTQLATGSWQLSVPRSLVHLDIDPEEIGRHYPVAAGVVGDAARSLRDLLSTLPGPDREPWATITPPAEAWTLDGLDVAAVLRRALPPDTILAVDVTRAGYIAMARYPMEERRAWLHPAGSVAMGYAIPAGLGALAAQPGRPVVAVVGDGGFQMSALELATAVQEELPLVVIVFNDSCLTLIKATQERHYPGRYIGVDLRNPDFGRLAEAFGVQTWRCGTEDELERAVRAALATRRPALVEMLLGG